MLSRFIRYFGSDLLVSIEDHGGMLEDNIGIPIILRMCFKTILSFNKHVTLVHSYLHAYLIAMLI